MRLSLLTLFFVACATAAFGQPNDCYEGLLQKGKDFYNAGTFDKAITKWTGALECPDLTTEQTRTLNEWITKAKNPPKPTPSVPKSPTRQSFEPEMVSVSGGTFTMGDVLNDNEYDDEKPTHSVTLSPFYIGKYEVSQAEWVAIMGSNPSYFKGDNLPVENVSWDDVQVYLQKLNAKTGKKYRLPTEAEWEYAAREGGKYVRFGNGKNTIDPAEINFDASASYKKPYSVVGEYRGKTVPVNSFAPNALGIYNMSGNVWEWCSDFGGSYSSTSQQNPTGPTTGSIRVIRGGSWSYNPQNCRATNRNHNTPATRLKNLGFRVVCSPQ
jgi:formylglycine-generating enzyme required for sulfatase activity